MSLAPKAQKLLSSVALCVLAAVSLAQTNTERLKEASRKIWDGQFSAAQKIYQSMIEGGAAKDEKNQAMLGLAKAYEAQKKSKEAAETLEKLYEDAPNFQWIEVLSRLRVDYLKLDNLKAYEQIDQEIRRRRDKTEDWEEKAKVGFLLDWDGSQGHPEWTKALEQYLKAHPEGDAMSNPNGEASEEVLLKVASLAKEAQKPELSLLASQRAWDLYPKGERRREVMIVYAEALFCLKQKDEMRAFLNEAIRNEPLLRTSALIHLYVYREGEPNQTEKEVERERAKIIEDMKRAVKEASDPREALRAKYFLAQAYQYAAKDYKTAAKLYREVLDAHPEDTITHYAAHELAWASYYQNDFAKAIPLFKEASKAHGLTNSWDACNRSMLISCYGGLKELETMKKEMAELVKRFPQSCWSEESKVYLAKVEESERRQREQEEQKR